MMRSALRGLVPTEILERKRKAFRSRAALAPLRNSEARIARLLEHSHAIAIGLVDPSDLMGAVHRTLHGNDGRWTHALMRLLLFEIWHEGLREHAPCLAATVRVETFVA